jgi:hypothetical protein
MESDTARQAPTVPPGVWLGRRVIWIVLAWLTLLTGADPDLWGHVRFGLDFLRDWRLPSIDPYSYTQDKAWVNHEWLSEALMAGAYRLGGPPGLVLLKASVVGLAYAVVIRSYRHAGPLVAEIVAVLVAVASLPLTMSVRPHIWSFAALAVLTALLQADSRARAVAVPAVLALWVNVHGGWILGIALVAIWCAGQAWSKRRLDRPTILIGAGSLLATLVNPYGWRLWHFIATTVRLDRTDITEWHPVWVDIRSAIGFWLLAAGVTAFFVVRRRTRPGLESLAFLAVLAYAAQRVQRLVPLFVLSTALLLAPAAARWVSRPVLTSRAGANSLAIRVVNMIVLTALLVFAAYTGWPHLRCIPPLPGSADAVAAAALRSAAQGRLLVEFDWGEYAIWHFSPALRVSIDGRRETIYSQARLDAQREMARGSAKGLALLRAENPEYVWMRSGREVLREALPELGYRLDVSTPDSFIAVRRDLAVLGSVPPQASGCFPET